MIAFHIGGREAEFVRVSITRDTQDGWLWADVKIAAGKFHGKYDAAFDTIAFSEFAKQVESLNQSPSGSATFTSLEGQLELTLKCGTLGHISVDGVAMDVAGTGNKLHFELGIDQSHLPSIVDSLQAMLNKHPVRSF